MDVLGHGTMWIATDTCQHVVPDLVRSAAERMEGALMAELLSECANCYNHCFIDHASLIGMPECFTWSEYILILSS